MKARLKTIILSAIGAISAFTTVTLTSCDDKCKSIVCAYEGVCNEGKCLCKTGYEGPQCETLTRQKFLGTWVATENRTLNNSKGVQYTLSLEPGPNLSEVRIKNLYNLFEEDVNAFVKGDSIYVPQQDLENYRVVGTGWIEIDKYYGENARITMKYKVTNQSNGTTDYMGVDGGDASLWNK
jgi:hypothetical protein